MKKSFKEIERSSRNVLSEAGVEVSAFEIKLLLADVLGVEPAQIGYGEILLNAEQIEKFETMLEARKKNKPVDKILGHKGFYKYDFCTSEDVLSPREDTEILVEEALALIAQNEYLNVLELGVGSGCVIVSLLADISELQGVGVDVSARALQVADENAQRLGVGERLILKQASWNDADFVQRIGKRFDLIVSNPPYIATKEIEELDAEVKNYDPLLALDGGDDGLHCYRQIAKVIPFLLKQGGYLLVEIGEGQAADVCGIFEKYGLQTNKIIKDLSGIERCISLKK